MNCPVEMTDYVNSLIAADWYEEMGNDHTAEAIRYASRNTITYYTAAKIVPYHKCSVSDTNKRRSVVISTSQTTRFYGFRHSTCYTAKHIRMVSTSRSRKTHE